MNSEPTHANSETRDADASIRKVLTGLLDTMGKGAAAKLAAEFEISPAQFARILTGERYLHPGQIMRARPAIRDALVRAMLACASETMTMSVESEAFALLGETEFEGEVARHLADGKLDVRERAKSRQSAVKRMGRLEKFVAAIDAADAKERG
jgi:hypothetical protein